MATGRFVGTKELLAIADALVRDIGKSGDTCYITEDGKAKAVLLDINSYNALMDVVEDAELPATDTDTDIQPESRERLSVKGILRSSKTELMRKSAAK